MWKAHNFYLERKYVNNAGVDIGLTRHTGEESGKFYYGLMEEAHKEGSPYDAMFVESADSTAFNRKRMNRSFQDLISSIRKHRERAADKEAFDAALIKAEQTAEVKTEALEGWKNSGAAFNTHLVVGAVKFDVPIFVTESYWYGNETMQERLNDALDDIRNATNDAPTEKMASLVKKGGRDFQLHLDTRNMAIYKGMSGTLRN